MNERFKLALERQLAAKDEAGEAKRFFEAGGGAAYNNAGSVLSTKPRRDSALEGKHMTPERDCISELDVLAALYFPELKSEVERTRNWHPRRFVMKFEARWSTEAKAKVEQGRKTSQVWNARKWTMLKSLSFWRFRAGHPCIGGMDTVSTGVCRGV
jgi:hypothetical protein